MKKTSKTLAILLSVILIAALFSGCGSKKTSGKTGTNSTYAYLLDTTSLNKPKLDLSNPTGILKDVLDRGVLRIATSPDYPPAEFITEDGTVYGAEMMLAKYVADCLGVDLAIETMDFGGTLIAVQTGKVDLGVSGYGWKADRAESFELTTGYIGDPDEADYHTLIVPAGKENEYSSCSDFVGKHILAQAGSLQQMYVEDQILALDPENKTELEFVATLDQAILGLAAGKCDAVALDGTTAEQYVKQSGGKFALSGVHFDLSLYDDYEGTVMAIKKGETAFLELINSIIATVKENGYYGEFYKTAKQQAGLE